VQSLEYLGIYLFTHKRAYGDSHGEEWSREIAENALIENLHLSGVRVAAVHMFIIITKALL
jgi:hypothetical protein